MDKASVASNKAYEKWQLAEREVTRHGHSHAQKAVAARQKYEEAAAEVNRATAALNHYKRTGETSERSTTTMAKTKKKAAPKSKKEFDFGDEDAVKAVMAKVLDISPEDLDISESHYGDFTGYVYYKLESGRQEWHVAPDENTAMKLAIAVVKQDLEESPENFEQNFIRSHIDVDRLRRDLSSDVEEGLREPVQDEAERRPIEFMKEHDIDIPEPTFAEMKKYAEAMAGDKEEEKEIMAKLKEGDAEDKWIEMGEEPEVPDEEIEKVVEEQATEQLKHPIDYLTDLYGDEEGVKRAIEIGGIDEQAAAEEAVGVDGIGHFLSSYDGNLHDAPHGMVYWRTN